MTATEARQIDQKLVDLAIQQTAALLLILPSTDRKFITRKIISEVLKKFEEHDHRFNAIEIMEIADLGFFIRVNYNTTGALLIERKEAPNA
jgi:predicted metal-dependent HD superfamily phosphohydrolase